MRPLVSINRIDDISTEYRNSSIESLLAYHNLGAPFKSHENAEVLIAMCMDNRKTIRIPDNFAYILRTGGANVRPLDFKISYAIALGKISAIALIGHNDCGMQNLSAKREKFIHGLIEHGGWTADRATEHFEHMAPIYEIDNVEDFVYAEVLRLRQRYPKILIAPMMYMLEDKHLYMIQ